MTDHTPRRLLDRRPGRRIATTITAAALLAVGGGAGALAIGATRPSVTMAPATPVAIRTLAGHAGDLITVRGRVAEIFGNKFVMADASGRALVDLGREGENGTFASVGQAVTVQGRFVRGSIHAAFLVGVDGKVTALGPLAGPPRGPRGDHDRPGLDARPNDRCGPRGPEDRLPSPPPAATPVAPARTAG